MELKPWREKMWCIPKVDSEFVARMEDVLSLYAEPPDEKHPVVCFVDDHYPDADRIRVVLDNLSTHTPVYERFEPAEARRILSRLEFHFTPKRSSWLNMVEIEIGVMARQCLDRRIGDKPTLVAEVAKWEQRRNHEKARIKWLFTVDRAREHPSR